MVQMGLQEEGNLRIRFMSFMDGPLLIKSDAPTLNYITQGYNGQFSRVDPISLECPAENMPESF